MPKRNRFAPLRDASPVKIVVFGAGAMGSFFGGLLSARHDVLLVGRANHVQAMRAHGLRIAGKTVLIAKPGAATKLPRDAEPDLVIVSTKAYDTAAAMISLRRLVDTATFLTLQNGLDNPDVIAKSARRVVAGTTSHGVTFVAPGVIRHAGVGDTVIGRWRGVGRDDVVRLRDILADAGIRTRITDDVRSELWGKVVVNASINPLAALAGVPNGRLVRERRLKWILEDVCREAATVARSDGAAVDVEQLLHRTVLVARRTASNRASMLQDLERGRRTEIDAITGAVLRIAARHGVAAPRNEVLYALVKAREAVRAEGAEA